MKTFKVVIFTSALEEIAYMIQAKNEMFARCSALIRYDKTYDDKIRFVSVTPI